MHTIQDTFNEIEAFQRATISEGPDSLKFKIDIMNFTSVLYFGYLAHTILDSQRAMLNLVTSPSGQREYYRLLGDQTLQAEFFRVNSIAHLFHIWSTYEHFIRTKYLSEMGTTAPMSIAAGFAQLIQRLGITDTTITEEFDVIRNTRNSLHDGGNFSLSHRAYSGRLKGTLYAFNPGAPVTPLPIMDVVNATWRHVKAFERI